MTVRMQLDRWPTDHRSAAWTGPNGAATYGDANRRFPLASVTKPLFAYAVLVAFEEGSLRPEQPAGPNGSTVAHLLAHASGLGEDLAQPLAGVERRRIYSNLGFELIADALADATGMTAIDYFRLAVVEPLGLHDTVLAGSAAHAAISTVDDLSKILDEWLAPTLIHPDTLRRAVTPQFPDLDGVLPGYRKQTPNPWGLGFEIRGGKQPHWSSRFNSPATFGHFGRAGTLIWVDPVAQVGCVALSDRDFGPWAQQAWPPMADAVLAEVG
ncbi:MAG: serine hydrolase domain-containing protein [Actinomycetota bacterium]